MLFKVTMKDPDGVYDSVAMAIKDDINKLALPDDEREALAEKREEKLNDLLSKWFEFGEYLTVEIDTEAETCTVVRR